MKDGFNTRDVFFAAVLKYLGYPLLRIEVLDQRTTEWGFDIASEDAAILREQYDSADGLALSSAKSFVRAYLDLVRQQKEMRRNGQVSWSSPAWINGQTSSGRKVS